ncbi:MAG: hypothetical protein J7623_19645 [Chitinophaga sp.]|nr:hypothetical protein [Chitinophaga sp.]MBO9730863.1 hypothetical protein [Chitinophaga sp.]
MRNKCLLSLLLAAIDRISDGKYTVPGNAITGFSFAGKAKQQPADVTG